MFNPVSTYRIQFHKGFTFKDFRQIIPYLASLGIKTIYASPIFKAVPESMHGYDVTDPLQINPEIGTLEELRAISKELKSSGINWLQDIVPNHMAFHPQNAWLMNVLEKGKDSQYAPFFDILWDSPVYNGRLMVPFLGKPWEQAVKDKEVKIAKQGDKLVFEYFGQQYPLNEQAARIIQGASLKKVNDDMVLINQIADAQHYRLCFWQETDKQINFRRFFTVNGLICLNMQDEKVFERYHQFIRQLLDEDIFQGLRVDHIDGLYDPKTYLERLRKLAGEDTYIIVEKILERSESFPSDWPVQGNTGYDFLAEINNLFTAPQSKLKLTAFYDTLVPSKTSLQKSIFEKKRLILYEFMQGELENLYQLFLQLQSKANDSYLKEAIGEILVFCPVYRFYQNLMPLSGEEAAAFEDVLRSVENYNPALSKAVNIIREALLGRTGNIPGALHFYMRLMQFAGPLMAKGVEDTLMYTYNRFIDHNEVGDSPEAFGLKPIQFHEVMSKRQQLWPLSLNATSTHDTKRGEDVRARLNVLSDIPEKWVAKVKEWQKINAKLKTTHAPDANDEYFIYQTIAGAYPMPGENEDDFVNRLQQYIEKALREGKENSGWAQPNEAYESAAKQFASELLDKKSSFWKNFAPFHQTLCDFGIINSLSQTLLKCTCPGTADLYQGCELWDLSLVDPDNRRPADYDLRAKLNTKSPDDWKTLWDSRYSGQIKLQLVTHILKQRKENTLLLAEGEYIPLEVKGKYKENIFAFARHYKNEWRLVIVTLHPAAISETADLININWHNTRIVLPEGAPNSWQNTLTGDKGYASGAIPVKEIFRELPLAMLSLLPPENERSAGVLMHITSLPSAYGVGDMGPAAYGFADFLYAGRQRYWQLLPVNPIDQAAGFSPYSASSVMAGNPLLISQELLASDGLLTENDLADCKQEPGDKVDFVKATIKKQRLLHKAFKSFTKNNRSGDEFESYKNVSADWLDDFALYEVLKRKHGEKPWHKWPAIYKDRDKRSLDSFALANAEAIDEIKWQQFLFASQWQKLRQYCDKKSITLLGDMPFYASYDSVDVWANPELFKLDKNGNIAGIAGVPPDYFSAEGQLWGMPVYNWDRLKEQHYDWWIKRIRKNLEYFELIRLDHFRAFSAYWEVPGGSHNAINGSWMQGPGTDFFDQLQKSLGKLPFVAEDLGEINDAVYELRDKYSLPGMRVLQFAFDDAMPASPHIPHQYTLNSFAYTGTHDNNTIPGWYKDADKNTRKRIENYIGKKVKAKEINNDLIRLCYASVAKTVIIPIQDILGLGADTRMNIPAAAEGNWSWRLGPDLLTPSIANYLAQITVTYNR